MECSSAVFCFMILLFPLFRLTSKLWPTSLACRATKKFLCLLIGVESGLMVMRSSVTKWPGHRRQ